MTPEELARLRALFPVCDRYLYLNHAGVAPTSVPVRDAVLEWTEDLLQHGLRHEPDWEARAEHVRAQAARMIGATPEEITFVRNTSHGLALVAEGLDWQPGDEVAVCTELEYPSVVYPWQHLASRGVQIADIPAQDGGVTVDGVASVLTEKTRLVAVSSVQYATGVRTPLEPLGRLCEQRGVLLLVDAIQSVGAVPTDVRRDRIGFLAADSHKWMLGLSGIGIAYLARELQDRVRPALVGWKSTTGAWDFDRAEFCLRDDAARYEEGSPSYTGIYGLGAALELLESFGVDRVAARLTSLLDRLDGGLRALGCDVSPTGAARAGILTFVPPRGTSAALLASLEAAGVVASVRRGRVRVSPHVYTSEEELDRLVALVAESIERR